MREAAGCPGARLRTKVSVLPVAFRLYFYPVLLPLVNFPQIRESRAVVRLRNSAMGDVVNKAANITCEIEYTNR